MKTKVIKIGPPYNKTSTESLENIIYNYTLDKITFRISTKQLLDISDELARRRQLSNDPGKTAEESWSYFVRRYYTKIIEQHH